MTVVLDAVTGLPLDDSYLTQYQIPLGSQPINLEELGALGRQSNWLYPDNLPGVVSRLQARDNTNPLNAQDLSTDGKRNLNVNIAENNSGAGGPINLPPWQTIYLNALSSGFADVYYSMAPCPEFLYGLSVNGTADDGGSGNFGGFITFVATLTDTDPRIPLACLRSAGKTAIPQSSTVMFPQPLALAAALGNPSYVTFRWINSGIDWDTTAVLYTSSSILGP